MLDIKTDLLAGPWHEADLGTVIKVTSPEQPGHAFAMLYVAPGGRSKKPDARMRATATVMLAGPAMYQALLSAKIAVEQLCMGQDVNSQCWVTLDEINLAIEAAEGKR